VPRTTFYEWDIETVKLREEADECDVIDHNHADRLETLLSLEAPDAGDELKMALAEGRVEDEDGGRWLVLVRDVGSNDAGLLDRSWAYVSGRKLPTHFRNALGNATQHRVPQKFFREFEQVLRKLDGLRA